MKQKVNLYIDTNVFLTFFHFSSEDLKELKKLIALINTKNIKLFLPEQTVNEFNRNREVKIADSLSRIRKADLAVPFPMICHAYEEYDAMKKAIKQLESSRNKLLDKLQHDAEKGTLLADDVLNQLLEKAEGIETNSEILEEAVTRFNIGNPPGKDKSYGDAINWVSLLNGAPDNEDLYFISDDKDYYSTLNDSNFNKFLLDEWSRTKNSKLHYFKRISQFFKAHYPDIELSSETEKEICINNLAGADSFANAKVAASRLLEYEEFSIKQLNDIATALVTNNQLYRIYGDYRIAMLSRDVIEANREQIDPEVFNRFYGLYLS